MLMFPPILEEPSQSIDLVKRSALSVWVKGALDKPGKA